MKAFLKLLHNPPSLLERFEVDMFHLNHEWSKVHIGVAKITLCDKQKSTKVYQQTVARKLKFNTDT